MTVLSGYASNREQDRASTMLTVTYDLRNRSEREPTWSPPVQPVALYQHRVRELLAKEPIDFDGGTYIPEMFDHYCQEMIEGTNVGRQFAALLAQKYHDFMMYDQRVEEARNHNWRRQGE